MLFHRAYNHFVDVYEVRLSCFGGNINHEILVRHRLSYIKPSRLVCSHKFDS